MGGRRGGFSGTTIKDTWTNPRQGGIRGGRRGKKGKGHQGTCIKDPWTKTTDGGKERMWEVGVGRAGNGRKMGTTVIEQ